MGETGRRLAAALDALDERALTRRRVAELGVDQVQPQHDRAQRIAQLVPEQGQEAVLGLARDLLAVQRLAQRHLEPVAIRQLVL